MKLSVTFSDCSDAAQDTLLVEGKLSEGKFAVYQVYSPLSKANYAMKVFTKTPENTIQYQKEQLVRSISHPNIIRQIPIQHDSTQMYAHFTELSKHGDFLSLIQRGILNRNEIFARTFFRHLVEGVEYIHSQGVAHLDLKLENLVLGSDFNLKIIDFDQAQLTSDETMTSGGTPCYRAPEVLYGAGACQDLASVDIYSMGIILYILKTGEFPFVETCDQNGEIKRSCCLFLKDNQEFWRAKACSFGNEEIFGEDFIELVNGMLELDPSKRLKIQDIKRSRWYNKQALDQKSLQLRMKARLINKKIISQCNKGNIKAKASYSQLDNKRN